MESLVHAIVPAPRSENFNSVVLHGADERGVSECCDHRIVFIDKACFGDAKRDAVAFAKVLVKPIVDAFENVFLLVVVVPFAGDFFDAVCTGVVVTRQIFSVLRQLS